MSDLSIEFFDSEVRHGKWIGKLKKEFIEGKENKIRGIAYKKLVSFSFINSEGDYSFLDGSIRVFAGLLFFYGKAFGYQNYTKGRFMCGFGVIRKDKIHLVIPSSLTEYISVSLKYREKSVGSN